MKFVDIKNDIAFRKIFGNEKKTEIIISFLNAILALPEGKLIKTVKIENPYQLPQIKDLKSSILDLRVTDERNVSYIVEMQVEELEGFDKRVQYYTAKQYSAQINKGEDYPQLNQVIFIGILDFKFFDDDTEYITRHRTVNVRTQKSTLNGMEYNFVELPKFNKELKKIKTLADKWIYFIKNAENLAVIPADVHDSGLKHAYEDADKHAWTKEELFAYDYASIRKQDERGKITKAEQKGEKIGREQKALEIAKKLIALNVDIDTIQKSTGLTIAVIENMLERQ